MTERLSIVIPVFNEAHTIKNLHQELSEALQKDFAEIEREVIYIDDGSSDQTWQKLREIAEIDQNCKALKLSRNFGQHIALSAGLREVNGNYVIVMDGDGQDDPKYLHLLYQKAKEGFDIIYTKKSVRRHNWIKNITARLYAKIFRFLSGNKQYNSLIGNYSLLKRPVVEAFNQHNNVHRHYLMVLQRLGFSHEIIPIEHRPRNSGKSSYNFFKIIKHAIYGITSQSVTLLYLSIITGLIFFVLAIGAIIGLIVLFFTGNFQAGWPSVIVLILVSTSFILISNGILGLYIGNIFQQVPANPLYTIEKKLNF